jgi:hypothetical protein
MEDRLGAVIFELVLICLRSRKPSPDRLVEGREN